MSLATVTQAGRLRSQPVRTPPDSRVSAVEKNVAFLGSRRPTRKSPTITYSQTPTRLRPTAEYRIIISRSGPRPGRWGLPVRRSMPVSDAVTLRPSALANCPLRKPCETCETLRNEKPNCETLRNLYLRKLAKTRICETLRILRNKSKTAKLVFAKPCETRICESCET